MSAKVAIVAGAGGGATGRETEVADTTDPAVTADLFDRIAAEVGPPDVLVNIIGAFGQGDALSTTPEHPESEREIHDHH